jgi:hypothetical protein
MTKARDISKLLSTANGKIAGANLDVSFENISDSGTAGTKVASGTTGQRGSTAGQIRFNSETNLAEYYTGTDFKLIDTPPTISSVDVTNVATDLGGNQTFVITGTNFQTGVTLNFRDVNGTLITPDTTTRNSSTQITVIKTRSSFSNANEPYDIIVTNISGLSNSLENQINVDNSPVWQTASGLLATINDNVTGTHTTVSATDSDGDTVVYSVQSGSLPAGLSLNTSTGAISGDPTNVNSATTSNFTLRATSNNSTSDRSFSITVNPEPIATTYLLVAGGGGGGSSLNGYHEAGTGGGAGGLLTGSTNMTLGTVYNFVVGNGGLGKTGAASGDDGQNTTGFSLTAIGGGGGTLGAGRTGGSGSGGTTGQNGGAGTAGQGNNGGNGQYHAQNSAASGGGGAGSAGGVGGNQSAGNGGAGLANSITGSSVTYAGGGGGAGAYNGGSSGSGGSGGGGNGNNSGAAGHGTNGLGGGGGGSHNGHRSGDGGKGVAIISLLTAKYSGTTTGSPTVTTSGANTILKFNQNGSYTA